MIKMMMRVRVGLRNLLIYMKHFKILSKVTESDGSEYFVPKQFKKKNIYLHHLSCHPIAPSSRHWRHNYVRDMFLRFLKRHKFGCLKESFVWSWCFNVNHVLPPNITGVDVIATQLDGHDTHYHSQVAGNGICPLNPVGEVELFLLN